MNSLIGKQEDKILLAGSNPALDQQSLKKNKIGINKLKIILDELQMYVQDSSSRIIEAEQIGIGIGFHRGHQSAKEEMSGGIPDRNINIEEYRNYNIQKAIKKWPELF